MLYTHTHGTTKENNKRRLEYLDIARTFAIISVVLCHAVELVYQMKLKGLTILRFQSQLFRLISFTFGRLGVPIFLFITGTLILNKKIGNDESCKKFYIKNLLPLLITDKETKKEIDMKKQMKNWTKKSKKNMRSQKEDMVTKNPENVREKRNKSKSKTNSKKNEENGIKVNNSKKIQT